MQLASGGAAQLAPSSTVTHAELLIAVEAEDRRDGARRDHQSPLVRLASAIEPEWLIDLFADRIADVNKVEWNRAAERVEGVSALMFGEIAIEETRREPDPAAAGELLATKAIEAGIGRFVDREEFDAFFERVHFASLHAEVPPLGMGDAEEALRTIAQGRRSFADLEEAARKQLVPALRRSLPREFD